MAHYSSHPLFSKLSVHQFLGAATPAADGKLIFSFQRANGLAFGYASLAKAWAVQCGGSAHVFACGESVMVCTVGLR